MKLTPTRHGWSAQLRFGKGERQRFAIHAPSETDADKRALIMQDLAALLVASGRFAEARPALVTLGMTVDGREFNGGAQAIRELCAEPLVEERGTALQSEVTFRDFGRLWTSGELARRYPDAFRVKKSVRSDTSRLEHLYRTVGSVPLSRFSLDDAERAMSALPATSRTSSSRAQYAQLIGFLLGKAVYPCRLLEHSPIPKGFKPRPSRAPEYPFLY